MSFLSDVGVESPLHQFTLFPWMQCCTSTSNRVMTVTSDSKLFNSERIVELLAQCFHLNLGQLGMMCNIPPVSTSLELDHVMTDCRSLEPDMKNSFESASERQITASDEFLKVLSEAVRLRVTLQMRHCHLCLLQKHHQFSVSSDTDSHLNSGLSLSSVSDDVDCRLYETRSSQNCDLSTNSVIK